MRLILIIEALGHPEVRFSGSRRTEFPFIHPHPRCGKWDSSPREPGRAIQVPCPPFLGLLNSIMRRIPTNEALHHPKMRFSQKEFRLSTPPPPRTVPKMRFSHHVSLAGQFRCPAPLIWGC